MSYTAIYTPLHPLDTPPAEMQKTGTGVTPGVRILDPDGIDEFVPDWDTDMHTHEATDRDEYPGRTWEYLEGFRTWDYDEFNIERLAIPSDDAVDFWAGLSTYTEPFQFFTAYHDGGYPHALDIVTGRSEKPIAYHVVCRYGDIWVREVEATTTEPELVYRGEVTEPEFE